LNDYSNRIEHVNADIFKYVPELENNAYDVCIWSESIYYIGAQRFINETYSPLKMIISKLKPGGLLVMANVVDLPEDIPESVLTKRPLIDCYFQLLSSIAASALKAIMLNRSSEGSMSIKYGPLCGKALYAEKPIGECYYYHSDTIILSI